MHDADADGDEGFDAAVARVLRALKPGDLVTYGEVAEEAGYPRAARAVGRFLATSDGEYPWWRVVTTTGRLVPGHEDEHRRRLEAEGHRVIDGHVVRSPAIDRFDRAYFDHWYREEGFGAQIRLDRKVDFALSAAEYLLDRPVRRVLDVGCGEGEWQPALARRRPKATYLGIDPSRYAVERFGRKRNLRLGRLADLATILEDEEPFDLIVCIDVFGYVGDAEAREGLATIARHLDGVALLEIYVEGDDIVGDLEDFRWRTASTFERWFRQAGLTRIGPHLYTVDPVLEHLLHFEGTTPR
jgi:alkylated DNA nucleotide flippase Atl1/SAM-dependent methyltransferase